MALDEMLKKIKLKDFSDFFLQFSLQVLILAPE
jgi:hypothetical protein